MPTTASQNNNKETVAKLRDLLTPLADPRADAVRLDQGRRLLASLLAQGQFCYYSKSSRSAAERSVASKGSAQEQWNDWLAACLDQLVAQLCERIQAGQGTTATRRTALRSLLGLIVAVASSNKSSTGSIVQLQTQWIRAIAAASQPSDAFLEDQTVRHLIQAEFLHPHKDLQYSALVALTELAKELLLEEEKASPESDNEEEKGDDEEQNASTLKETPPREASSTAQQAESLLQLLMMVHPITASQAELEDPQIFASQRQENPANSKEEAVSSDADGDSSSSDEDEDDGDTSDFSDSEQEENKEQTSKKRKLNSGKARRNRPGRHDWTLLSTHRRAWSQAWLAVLRLPLSTASLQRALLFLPQHVLPVATRPLRFADFFMTAYQGGGFVTAESAVSTDKEQRRPSNLSVLALEGLFGLMLNHGLECRDFYKNLYRLVTPSLFYSKHKSRFLVLLTRCLQNNDLLPAHVVAAFIKRLARCALQIPTPATLFVLTFISNLIRRHPETASLIHRGNGESDGMNVAASEEDQNQLRLIDGFDATTDDPEKANALQSSLWELNALEHHVYPAVVTLAKSIGRLEELKQPLYNLGDEDDSSFLYLTYRGLFEQERKRVRRKQQRHHQKGSSKTKPTSTPLTFTEPATLFPQDNVFRKLLDVPSSTNE